jgi:hypothetical protein
MQLGVLQALSKITRDSCELHQHQKNDFTVIERYFRTGLDARDIHDVQKAVAFSVPLGNNLFKERIEAILGKSAAYIVRGRPKQG